MLDFHDYYDPDKEDGAKFWDEGLGYSICNDGKASLSSIGPHIRKQTRSSVCVCLNFRLLTFRFAPAGSLCSFRPPGGF